MGRAAWVATILIVLAGCAGGPRPGSVTPHCAFGDAPDSSAPEWVCGEALAGVAVSAVGSAERNAQGYGAQKTAAVAAARQWLVDHLRAYVGVRLKAYAAARGKVDESQLGALKASVDHYITTTTVLGGRIYRTAISPAGTLYVLVGLSDSLAAQQARAALRLSMQNEPALWRRFADGRSAAGLVRQIAPAPPERQP